jgi:membrane-associated phospholipid phosphatase
MTPGLEPPAVSAATPSSRGSRLRGELNALDLAVYRATAGTPTPGLDDALRRLSRAADYSKLSLASAGVLALVGGPRGRRAAVAGLASLAVTTATVNVVGKYSVRRTRPDREAAKVVVARHARMPVSSSFPSGHSAAAFAFATGVGHQWPAAAVPLRALAALVAYSRVHTGVHYPGDVIAGSLLGGALAQVTSHAVEGRRQLRAGQRGDRAVVT